MKLSILLILLFLSSSLYAQENLVIFYFGATSCGPCNRPEVVKSIKEMKVQFDSVHKNYKTKFVMVCMDKDIAEGLNFIKKYGFWDEISIGSFYNNELVLANLNKAAIPGVPHIFIYKELFEGVGNGIEVVKDKKLIKEIVGGKDIVKWVNSGLKLK